MPRWREGSAFLGFVGFACRPDLARGKAGLEGRHDLAAFFLEGLLAPLEPDRS